MVRGQPPIGAFASLRQPLDRIVRKALATDPNQRYGSAVEMRSELMAAASRPAGDNLAVDESYWLRAVALVLTLATAIAFWALLRSLTPRVVGPGDVEPLVMLNSSYLQDGRLVSWARFETWPTLAATAAAVVALSALGLLRRHWREGGLDSATPERRVAGSTSVLVCGVAALAVYLLRLLAEKGGLTVASTYVPLLGGMLELAVVFLAWMAVLEAWRTQRPLQREPRLWLGLAIALLPPVASLFDYLRTWRP
jgi:serine/threonine-protein kinase